MQRREFLKGLVSLPLLAAMPAAALFRPRTVQDILDEWRPLGQVAELVVWDKELSLDEMAVYLNSKPALLSQMPASGNIKHWFPLGTHVQGSSVPKGQWVNRIAATRTETVAIWMREAA